MSNTCLYTIGFTKKSAKEFFGSLINMNIRTLIDIRLKNSSQLAGFTRGRDLPYFLNEICACSYVHIPSWAPTKEILDSYKQKKIVWEEYEKQFISLLTQRDIITEASNLILDKACLLCSEPTADRCHRRLVADYLAQHIGGMSIRHL